MYKQIIKKSIYTSLIFKDDVYQVGPNLLVLTYLCFFTSFSLLLLYN